ncbi:MAG: MBL fold metallo-hydrolase [Candidatus Latescibacteria bacterium]|nr:MBL fold metallo-hydrolase [Candidatus Latescibacterota bacterium]NIO28470.1 MBL fold metallo-hydrolase [Candidatus Latescibacterota bacterium]NIO56019.1 MBL fold metallo-hydrolase [Candidatus Latescibacterota bacterium]NIT01983.1 MBL fold metallo-hydrolase [Candidatus Latescibacterota bacterium]
MAKLTFLGATGTVTGSRFLLEVNNDKLLIDCGMFQGPKKMRLKNWEPLTFSPSEVDSVLLTHAHIDHSGFLPRFCKDGFKGPIRCTYPTYDLCEILLKDSAHLQEEDAAWANKKGFSKHKPALPLYTVEDAEKTLKLFQPLYYGEDYTIGDGIRLKFKDAGHILGSAFIDVKVSNGEKMRKILFSGDLGRPERPILRDPVQVFNVDYLVLESTYGNRLHEDVSQYDELAGVINDSVKRGGVLVIPAFAIGRTQTLLYVIRELEEQRKIPSLPIYVDSPMAIDATDIFRKRISDQDLASRILALEGKKLFQTKHLHLCDSREESKAINKIKSRAIIISASGMVTGGRILHHMIARLPNRKNTVLFIGYQAEGTRGRAMLEGKETVRIHGENVPVRAHIENISGFSGHADYNETLAWLMGFNKPPEKIFLVHGEPEASKAMAEKIRKNFSWDVIIPELDESVEIDL